MASTDSIVRNAPDGGELTLSLTFDESAFLIELFGELDLATAPELEQVIERARGTDVPSIIIDLSGLEFMDSTGIAVLINATRASENGSGRIKLLRGTAQVERLLALCGVEDRLPFID